MNNTPMSPTAGTFAERARDRKPPITDYSLIDHVRDPYTGRIAGLKHGPCRACGRRKIISSATLLCVTASCMKRRDGGKRAARMSRRGGKAKR